MSRRIAGSAISSCALAQARSAAATSRARSCVSQVKPSPSVCHSTWSPKRSIAVALAGLPGALAELHDAAAKAAAERAQQQAQGRRRFALALAGMDDQQALPDGLRGDLGVLRRPCGWPSWPCGGPRTDCRSLGMSFLALSLENQGKPGCYQHDAILRPLQPGR